MPATDLVPRCQWAGVRWWGFDQYISCIAIIGRALDAAFKES